MRTGAQRGEHLTGNILVIRRNDRGVVTECKQLLNVVLRQSAVHKHPLDRIQARAGDGALDPGADSHKAAGVDLIFPPERTL